MINKIYCKYCNEEITNMTNEHHICLKKVNNLDLIESQTKKDILRKDLELK